MKNLNFFSENLMTEHIFKNDVELDPIFKNIFFYYGKYLTKNEKIFMPKCK